MSAPTTSSDPRPVALVTGGSRGIGFGIALELGRAGFDLAINGVRPESDLGDALDPLRETGATVIYVAADISQPAGRANLLDAIRDQLGRLNVLVNNAGVAPKERLDILDATEESFEYVLGINLRGPYFLTAAAARWMVEQKQSAPDSSFSIINIGSISATVASTNRGDYCVAKAGMGMMTALFAARLGDDNIPVYELRPGITRTDMTAAVTEKYDRLIDEGLCVTRRWGEPSDVGRAATALARGDFPYSTGAIIPIDGGLTLLRL